MVTGYFYVQIYVQKKLKRQPVNFKVTKCSVSRPKGPINYICDIMEQYKILSSGTKFEEISMLKVKNIPRM